ncbi:MAG: AsmA-like C-terminal region-containing protein [Pseudomonadota bacterium]
MKNAAPPLSLIAALQVGVGDERSDLLLGSQGQGTAAAGLGSAWLAFGRGASGAGMAAEASVRFTGDVADVSLDTLDLAAAERLLHTLLPNASRLRRWVHELEPRGTVRHLDARYRFATEQLSWRADLKSVAATGYRGIPTVAALDTQLLGYERGLQANVEIDDGEVGFVGIFPAPWPVHRLAAELNLHYRTGLLNLWADTIHVELRDPPTAAADTETAVARPIYTAQGRFRLTVPQAESLRRLALTIDMPAASVALAQQFLPAGLSSELRQWLLEAPRAGGFEHPRLAFAGDLKGSAADRQLQVDRRLALRGGFRDASLDYAAGWPGIDSASGTLEVSGSQVFAAVSAGRSAGVDITGSELSVGPPRDGLRTLGLTLRSRFEGPQGLAFLRRSPLLETVAFVTPDWRASGPAALAGRLSIPLGADTLEATGTVELTLDGTGLTMPGYGLALTGLDGVVTLDLPNQVRGTGLSGALHGEPIDFSVSSTPESSRIDFSGMATAATAGAILDQPPVGFASGRTAYQGWIDLPLPPSAAVPRLHVDTDLEGLRLELPAELGKSTRARRPTQLAIEFHDTEQWLSLVQAPLGGWFTVRDGTLIDGHAQILGTEEAKALGPASQFARRDPTTGTGGEGVRVTGGISAYDIADTGEDELGDILFQFDRFHIAELAVQAMPLGWVNLSGPLSGPLTRLEVTGSRLTGSVAALGDEPMVLDLESALLPDPYANGAPLAQLDTREVTEALTPQVPDPLDVSLIDELPAMVVRLGALTLGAEDFGSWSFELEPDAAGLRVRNLEADWLGLHIEGQDVLWSRSPNETVFAGTITGGDLKEILPRWGYVSPVVSESVELAVEVAWEGSPLNLELLELEGEAEFTARNGRFEDVESAGGGALRLLSLLNFNAVARRMNLDFSDVFGRGISFERINAISALDHGRLTLLKPMEIEGTGSSFALSGTVDLDTGLLDSEMVVTLPLTKGLPWYAAYVALANPLAGLGVLVGERVLRKPLEQFSSAKYEVRGSLDDPAVKLVGIFDNRIGSSGTVETPEPIAIDPTGLDPQ